MKWLMIAGGAPMWVVLVFGLVGLGSALQFALRPARARLPFLGAVALAVVFAAACGVMVDLATVSVKVPEHPEWVAERGLGMMVLMGVGESLAPAILGSAVVSIMSLLTGLGLRRL